MYGWIDIDGQSSSIETKVLMNIGKCAAYPPPSSTAYVAPPPAGYPTKDDPAAAYPQNQPPVETKSRGDGFWKGW